ncbi:MAG TPA: hypothetical protein VHF23_06380 [Gaiellaceae bacterium]|nr:hypothetical protein [Gaiellaceae bacterium]
MDAASSQPFGARGAPRLLHVCAALERASAGERPSARARLESEVGSELAELLLGALATGRRGRPHLALV